MDSKAEIQIEAGLERNEQLAVIIEEMKNAREVFIARFPRVMALKVWGYSPIERAKGPFDKPLDFNSLSRNNPG